MDFFFPQTKYYQVLLYPPLSELVFFAGIYYSKTIIYFWRDYLGRSS